MKIKSSKKMAFGLLIVSMTLLPGCAVLDWVKGLFGDGAPKEVPTEKSTKGFDVVKDGSETIVLMEGEPIVTKASLEKEYQQLIKDNPQIAQMLPLMGGKDQLMRRLVNALTERQIVKRYIVANQIDQQAAYQAELDRMLNSVKDMLNVKYFNQNHPVEVADKDVKEFYEKNKETMPDLLVSRGGVRAMGVKFGSKDKAQEFLSKVNAANGDITKAAQDEKLNLEDFKLVNAQSVGMSPELRDKVAAFKKTPTTDMVELNDKTVWVVRATAKEEPTYHEYDKVMPHLKKYLEDQKREQMLGTVMEDLKKKYDVDVKEQAMPAPLPSPKAKMPMKKASIDTMADKEQDAKKDTIAQAKKTEQDVQLATQTV